MRMSDWSSDVCSSDLVEGPLFSSDVQKKNCPSTSSGRAEFLKAIPMTPPKALISDKMDPKAEAIFKERGIQVDVITGKTRDELIAMIGDYDGLAIRSATKVTADVLAAATNLKVVGRAGIGVDNVDIPEASKKGVIVMNTPFGNSITTAEHAIAMMFAIGRAPV